MNPKKTLIIVVAVMVIAVGAGILMYAGKNNTADNPTPGNGGTNTPVDTEPSDVEPQDEGSTEAVTITYSDNGFSPSSVTVSAGQKLVVSNTSREMIDFSSDPHPSHTNNPELNIGEIEPGESGSATIRNKGTWGYHDHFNPNETGTIIIQ